MKIITVFVLIVRTNTGNTLKDSEILVARPPTNLGLVSIAFSMAHSSSKKACQTNWRLFGPESVHGLNYVWSLVVYGESDL